MKILPYILILIISIIFAFTEYNKEDNTVNKVQISQIDQDTLIFADSVQFNCHRCGYLNIRYLRLRIFVPKCN